MYAYGLKGAPAVGGGLPGLPRRGAGTGGVGEVALFARDPGAGWLPADGRVLAIKDYPALYAKIGSLPSLPLSESSGVNWEEIPVDYDEAGWIVGTDRRGTWIAAADGTIIRTKDNGGTWEEVFSDPAYSIRGTLATDGAGIWMATLSTPAGLLISRDNGDTWSFISFVRRVSGVAHVEEGVWLASGFDRYIWRTTDSGITWSVVMSGSANSGSYSVYSFGALCFAVTNIATIQRSLDYGQTWGGVATGVGNTVTGGSILHVEGDVYDFYAQNQSSGVSRSFNRGASWAIVPGTAAGSSSVRGFAAKDYGSGTVLARISSSSSGRFPGLVSVYTAQDLPIIPVEGRLVCDDNGTWMAGHDGKLLVSRPYLYETKTDFILPDYSGFGNYYIRAR